MQGNMATMQASSLIGATVDVESATNNSQETSGVVTAVDMSSGAPEIQVNGELYGLSQILSITPTPTAPATTPGAAVTPTPIKP